MHGDRAPAESWIMRVEARGDGCSQRRNADAREQAAILLMGLRWPRASTRCASKRWAAVARRSTASLATVKVLSNRRAMAACASPAGFPILDAVVADWRLESMSRSERLRRRADPWRHSP